MSATHDVTRLLAEWAAGNRQALDDLTPLVYRELRQLAASSLRKKLEGNEAMQLHVLGFVDDSHPATAQFLEDPIVRDGLPDHRVKS